MKCFHVLRNSPDWIEIEKNYESHNFNPVVKEKMKTTFKQWNELMKPSYFVFREKIAYLTRKNHSKLDVDEKFLTAFEIEKKLLNLNCDYLVLFSDDDDWYNRKLICTIKEHYYKNPNIDAIIWNHCAFCSNYIHFEKKEKSPYFILKEDLSFHTNNYALTNNFFKKLSSKDVDLLNYGIEYELYYGHNNLDVFFKNRLNICKINDWFSMSNKNITSYSFWLKNRNVKIILDLIKNSQYIKTINPPSNLIWAKEEVNQRS